MNIDSPEKEVEIRVGLRPTKQARSTQTLERILQATQELLQEKEFEDITVAEIVQRANTSCGALYGRFSTKEDLLPALYDAYSKGLPTEETVWSEPSDWGECSLVERVTKLVQFVVRDFRRTRPFMRSLAIYARQHPNAITAENRRRSYEKHRASCSFLLDCRGEISHPDPDRAIELIAYFIPAICRDKVLFGDAPHASSVEIDDLELEEQLIHLALGFLRGNSGWGSVSLTLDN